MLLSENDDSHLFLADVGNGCFSMRINDEKGILLVKLLDSFSYEIANPFQSFYKYSIKKNTKTFLQEPASLNDTDIADNDDPIEKRIP